MDRGMYPAISVSDSLHVQRYHDTVESGMLSYWCHLKACLFVLLLMKKYHSILNKNRDICNRRGCLVSVVRLARKWRQRLLTFIALRVVGN